MLQRLYRPGSSRSHLGKQRRRRLSPALLVLAIVVQPLLVWAWYRPDSSLKRAASHLYARALATSDPVAFWPSPSPLPVHHSAALLDYSNHPVAPSRPPAHQFLFSPELYAQSAPAIAVVTTTRDAHPYWLRETASSVFGQSLHSLVWLIVDDATTSPDALAALKDLAKDPRVVVLRNEVGMGVGRSRNRALEHLAAMDEGRGPRYVASLEDDDLLELTALEKVRRPVPLPLPLLPSPARADALPALQVVFMLESNELWDLGGFQVVRFGEENSLGYGGLHTGAKHLVSVRPFSSPCSFSAPS